MTANAQPFWQKATVQSAVVTGIISALAVVLAVWLPSHLDAPQLREENQKLERKISDKDHQIQELQTLLVPFKTVAFQNFTGTEGERLAQLALHLNEVQLGLETLVRYQSVAKLNARGLTGMVAPDGILMEHTPIGDAMAATIVNMPENRTAFKTTDEALAIYHQVIQKFPDFPFSYFALAIGLRDKNNPSWVSYAETGVKIFERTTSLPEHNKGHDECLQYLQKILKEAKSP